MVRKALSFGDKEDPPLDDNFGRRNMQHKTNNTAIEIAEITFVKCVLKKDTSLEFPLKVVYFSFETEFSGISSVKVIPQVSQKTALISFS
jgi:hypothetical protein